MGLIYRLGGDPVRREHPSGFQRRARDSGAAEGVGEAYAGGQLGAEADAAAYGGGADEGGYIG